MKQAKLKSLFSGTKYGRMKKYLSTIFKFLKNYYTTNILIFGIILLISWPLLLLVFPYLPKVRIAFFGGISLSYLLTFLAIITSLIYVFKRIKPMVYLFSMLSILVLTGTTLKGVYGFKDVINDYLSFVNQLKQKSAISTMMSYDYEPFMDAARVAEMVNQKSSEVRNFAVKAATKNFQSHIESQKDRKLIQYFSIFKEINSKWVYVADPVGEEYFATPMETIDQLSIDEKFNGDCDDYAILMAACLKYVGGKIRLVRTPAHIYPELKIESEEELQHAVKLIRTELFKGEVFTKSIFYHTDPLGNIWLNFDYTNQYPGGKFLDNEIIGILEF